MNTSHTQSKQSHSFDDKWEEVLQQAEAMVVLDNRINVTHRQNMLEAIMRLREYRQRRLG